MFTVNVTDLRRLVGREFFTETDMRDVLDELGTYAMSEVQQNFEKLSRRGTGVDGTKWKELEVETEIAKAKKGNWKPRDKKGQKKTPPKSQIGVDTGLMRNAVVPGYSGGDKIYNVDARERRVTVGFGRVDAKHFDKLRPLIPERTPEAWVQEMEGILGDFVEDMLRRRTAG